MPVYYDIQDARQEYIKTHSLTPNIDLMSFSHFVYSNMEYNFEDFYMDYGAFIDEIHAKFPGSDPIEVVTDITIVVGENERKIFKEWAKYSDC